MTTLARAFVELLPSLKGIGRRIDGEMGPELDRSGRVGGKRLSDGLTAGTTGLGQSLGSSIGRLAVAGMAGLAGAGLTGMFTSTTSAASDLAETVNKASVIFGGNAAAIGAWASTAATTMGLSKQAALEAAAGFGDMFSQLGFAGDASAKMSQAVVQMSADLGSFNNVPTADVADMISGAFRGEYDSLQRLIPNISAARVQQEAMAATGKKTAAELTAAEKATATLAIVQQDGARAAGDFARTSDGVANKTRIQAAEMENLRAKIGDGLLPVQSALLNIGLRLTEWVSGHLPLVGSLAGAVAVAGAAYAGTAAYLALTTAGTVAHTAVMAVARAATAVWTGVQWALNAALSANPIGLVVVGLGALVAALVYAWNNSESFRTVVLAVWGAIRGTVAAALSWITSAIPGAWNTVTAATSNAVDRMRSTVSDGVSALVSFVAGLPGRILAALGDTGSLLWNAGSRIIQGLLDGISAKFAAVKDMLGRLTSLLPSWKGPPDRDANILRPSGRLVIGGFIDGIESRFGDVESILGSLTSSIPAGLAPGGLSLAGTASPTGSAVFNLFDADGALIGRMRGEAARVVDAGNATTGLAMRAGR